MYQANEGRRHVGTRLPAWCRSDRGFPRQAAPHLRDRHEPLRELPRPLTDLSCANGSPTARCIP